MHALFAHNVPRIPEVLRSETKQNLGEGRAEPRTIYPLLYAPAIERKRAQRVVKRSGVISKNVLRSQLSDRLSSIIINLIFSVLENERGARVEFHFSPTWISLSFGDIFEYFSPTFSNICMNSFVLYNFT